MDSIASFFGLKKSSSSTTNKQQSAQRPVRDSIVISFEDRYYDIHFRDVKGGIEHATVAELKERCKRVTGVTLATMKLKVSGAYIKDDTATLRSSGIHTGSVVFVIGERVNSELVKQTASGNPEEVGYMTRISKVMKAIDGSKDKIEEFDIKVISVIEGGTDIKTWNEHQRKEIDDLGIYLSELLMQSLITLDGVDCPSEFETARAHRRQGVKQCQALMDRVDQSRAVLKQLYSTNKL